MSKRLFFSDIHLHTWSYGATVDKHGFNSRLSAQRDAIVQMVKDAQEENVEYAYFTGDLFHIHGTVSTQALTVAAELFNSLRKAGIKIRTIYGNHDMGNRSGHLNSLAWLPLEETIGIWEDDGGLPVYGLPYTDDQKRLEEFLAAVDKRGGGMLMLHQGVSGVPLSSGYVLDEKLIPEMIPSNCFAFTGHYHFHRVVVPRLVVVGNLTPLNWGDLDQQKGWLIWDDRAGSLTQKIQTAAPEFITFTEGMQKSLVTGKFVRYNTSVTSKEIDSIRAELIKEGARTVEFPQVKINVKQDKIRTGHDITIEHILDSVTSADMTPRRREVGSELRENKYEVSN